MAKPITVSIGDVNLTISNGDLPSDGFAQFVSGELKLASDVIGAVLNKPISDLSTDILQASLAAQKDLSWTLGSISLQLSPSAQGTVTIRKSGEVFRFTESEQDDDPSCDRSLLFPREKPTFPSSWTSISACRLREVSATGVLESRDPLSYQTGFCLPITVWWTRPAL